MMDEAAENGEIRVMHVEDHAGFRVLVKNLLNSQSDMTRPALGWKARRSTWRS